MINKFVKSRFTYITVTVSTVMSHDEQYQTFEWIKFFLHQITSCRRVVTNHSLRVNCIESQDIEATNRQERDYIVIQINLTFYIPIPRLQIYTGNSAYILCNNVHPSRVGLK